MRDFKFRAWNGRSMEYGGFHIHATGTVSPDPKCKGLTEVTKDSPVMQYTGLKDKNGKEIYEGDIVQNWHEELFFQDMVIGSIEWENEDLAYYIDYGSCALCLNGLDHEYMQIEIIGNIYENPELLT